MFVVEDLEGKSSAHADAVLQKTGDDIDLTRKFSISAAKKVNRCMHLFKF